MNRRFTTLICILVGLAFAWSSANAQDVKASAGKKQIGPKVKTVKPLGIKAKLKLKDSKKLTKKKKSSKKSAKKKKTKLFDKVAVGKTKNQKFRNAYLLAVVSKLVYQAEKNQDKYRDSIKPSKKKKGKIKTGGKVNPKRFARFGLELCNADMPYWTTKKNKKGKKVIDAQAYLLHNDSSVILAFRGSKEKADWKTNGDALVHYKLTPAKKYGKDVKVHRGFLDATEQAHKQFKLQSEIKKCLTKGGKKRKLLVTGHSLGGAMATLWTYYFRRDNKVQASRLYTYGAPSAGNKNFVKSFDRLLGKKAKAYSWVNQDDPVTGVTWSLGFRRTGKAQWITCPGVGQLCKSSKLIMKNKVAKMRGPGLPKQHYMTQYIDRILQLSPKKVRKELKNLGAGKKVNALLKAIYK